MTNEEMHLTPETPVIDAMSLLLNNNLDSLPVIDKDENLVGTLTRDDLIIKESSVHLPTLVNLFNQLDFYKKDQVLLKYNLKRILWTKFRDVMQETTLTTQSHALREIDKNVNTFLKDIRYQFVIVSKTRVRLWLLVSILFSLVGYAIAWILILRVH